MDEGMEVEGRHLLLQLASYSRYRAITTDHVCERSHFLSSCI